MILILEKWGNWLIGQLDTASSLSRSSLFRAAKGAMPKPDICRVADHLSGQREAGTRTALLPKGWSLTPHLTLLLVLTGTAC